MNLTAQETKEILDRIVNELENGTPERLDEHLKQQPETVKQHEEWLFSMLKKKVPHNGYNFADKFKVMLSNGLEFNTAFFWNSLFFDGEHTTSPASRWWLTEGWQKYLPKDIGQRGVKMENFLDYVVTLTTKIAPDKVAQTLQDIPQRYPSMASKFSLGEESRRRIWGRLMEEDAGRAAVKALQQGGCALPENFNINGPNSRHEFYGIGVKLACVLTNNDLNDAFDSPVEIARLSEDIRHYQQELLEDGYVVELMRWLTKDNFDFALKTRQTKENVLHCLFHYPARNTNTTLISAELNAYVEENAVQFLTETNNVGKTCFEALSCGYDKEIVIEGRGPTTIEQYRAHLLKLAMDRQITPPLEMAKNSISQRL